MFFDKKKARPLRAGHQIKRMIYYLLKMIGSLESQHELRGCAGRNGEDQQQQVGELQRITGKVDSDTVILVLEAAEEGVEIDALHLVVEEWVAVRHGHITGPLVDVGGDDVHVLERLRVELDVVQELFDGAHRIVGGAIHRDNSAIGGSVAGLTVGNNSTDHVTSGAKSVDIVIGLDHFSVIDHETLRVVVGGNESSCNRCCDVVFYSEGEKAVNAGVHIRISVLEDDSLSRAVSTVREIAVGAVHDILFVFVHFDDVLGLLLLGDGDFSILFGFVNLPRCIAA